MSTDQQGSADEDCLFCKIVSGDIGADVVHESPTTVAFRDLNPQAPTHVLVIPRSHYPNAVALAAEEPDTAVDLFAAAGAIADSEGLGEGYRLVFNTGASAHQTVFHAHLHVLGGRVMTWPPRMTRMRIRTAVGAVLAVLALVLSACGAQDDSNADAHKGSQSEHEAKPSPTETADAAHEHGSDAAPAKRTPLRAGERKVTVRMPKPYTPSAPTGTGTDDYRCFLLDPKVPSDQFITGFNIKPGNPDVVHHVILFRVPADLVAEAEKKDAGTPGQGWTCFGASGLGRGAGGIDDTPWVGAWAPGGSEQVYGNGFGEELGKGSRVVMQVHYNLLAGKKPDRSGAELRLAPVSDDIKPLETRLLPAPVEMPCRPQYSDGELCARPAAVKDLKKRFGRGPGSTADLLHFLCGEVNPGPVQSCTQTVTRPETVRGVAGHMHLLGRSIKLELNPGEPDARTLLNIPMWDFDNQASHSIEPTAVKPGDKIKVTCKHEQALRDQLPSFKGQPDKYVLWGDGTTDEMCLGIMLVTRP